MYIDSGDKNSNIHKIVTDSKNVVKPTNDGIDDYVSKEGYFIPERDPRELNVIKVIRGGCPKPVDPEVMPVTVLNRMVMSLVSGVEDAQEVQVINNFRDSLASGGSVAVESCIKITDQSEAAKMTVSKDTELNFGTNNVFLNLPDATSETKNWVGVDILGGSVVFDGTTGGIVTAANPELYAAVLRNGGNLTINGGNYVGGTTAIQAIDGIVTINDGFFKCQVEDPRYTLNCIDSAYKAGTADFVVKGGTFVNFDPSNNLSEGPETNFVAEGYTVTSEIQEDGEIWYTVVPVESSEVVDPETSETAEESPEA